MKTTKTILNEMATKIINNVSNYDFDESATVQYDKSDEWESFFVDMAHSRGWTKILNEREFEDSEEATDYMVIMLDRTIEKLKEA
ncbi:hypothetical protein ACFQZE_07175 [Paenibacillus sp. GCM10027627]|uniref:hypothetical protein n=1 Tax=unclassified Paenibacillus TaxID=185978 RepID=UPI003644C77A